MITMRSRGSISLILLSAASLTYEICLTRIFAIQQFHSFAFIVISLAVMGFAASGIALTLIPRQPSRPWLANAFALSALLAYALINYLPFDSYSIVWDRSQLWVLALYFTAAGIPFLCAGWFIGGSLREAGQAVSRPYAANLVGSSAGCLIALISLQIGSEEAALGFAITLGILASVIIERGGTKRLLSLTFAAVVFAAFTLPLNPVRLRLSPYKPLSIARQFPGASIQTTEHSASARVDVLASQGIHTFPGLSLSSPVPPTDQIGLFIDGEGPFPITDVDLEPGNEPTFTAHMPAGLAYQLRPGAAALIVDPGTGLSAQIALASGAGRVSLPADEPLIPMLLGQDLVSASGNFLQDPRLVPLARSSRGSLSDRDELYTIVEWSLSDPFRPIASGAFSLSENFLLTRDAFEQGWQRLSPDGLLVITRWLGTPPSEATRVWSTLLEALRQQELPEIENHLVAFRGMRTMTMLASKRPFQAEELAMIRGFLEANAFDPVHLPDLQPGEVNRTNRLPEPVYHQLFQDLLRSPSSTIRGYAFRLEPTRDDQPYFFHFFRWEQSSEILATLGLIWQPFGGSGYFVLLLMLALMLLLATPLMLLPWLSFRGESQKRLPTRWVWLYFGGLGAGFMLVEIALIMRLQLLLDYPVLAFGLVLFVLLLSSGMGSLHSERISLRTGLIALIALIGLNLLLLPTWINQGLSLPLLTRVLITILWLAPLGFFMGIPFPSGMRQLETRTPGMIPWAWAINGAVSGVSGVLASLALLDLGFQLTLGLGGGCYLAALLAWRRWNR